MLQLGLVDIILADREREVEATVRRRRLLKPLEEGEALPPLTRRTASTRSIAVRARPTAG